MDLTKVNPRVEHAVSAQKVESRLPVVTLSTSVDISLGEDNDMSSGVVPLELNLVALEERLLRNRLRKLWHIEDLDSSRLTLERS